MSGNPSIKMRQVISVRLDSEIEKDLLDYKKKLEKQVGLKLSTGEIIRKLIRVGLLHSS